MSRVGVSLNPGIPQSLLTRLLIFVLLTTLLTKHAAAQESADQKEITSRLFVPHDAKSQSILSLELSATEASGIMLLRSGSPVSMFSGKDMLWSNRMELRIPLDSLQRLKGDSLKLTIVRHGIALVRVWLITAGNGDNRGLRQRSFVIEFVVLAALPVLLLLVLLGAAYPRMLQETLDVTRIFSWLGHEESSGGLRNISTTSLFLSLALVGFISIPFTVIVCNSFNVLSLSGHFAWFLAICAMFSGLLLWRTTLLAILPRVYGMNTGLGQYTGFLLAMIVISAFAAALFLLGFMSSVQADSLQVVFIWVWIGGISIYYAVLLVRLLIASPPNALHLFSYLCITEIIPILLFIGLFQSQAHLDLR